MNLPKISGARKAEATNKKSPSTVHTQHSKRGSSFSQSTTKRQRKQPNRSNEYLRPTPPPPRLQAVSSSPVRWLSRGGCWVGSPSSLFYLSPLSLARLLLRVAVNSHSLARVVYLIAVWPKMDLLLLTFAGLNMPFGWSRLGADLCAALLGLVLGQ